MTAIRETHDVTTVSRVAGNGQWLTVADLAIFVDECGLEGVPEDTIIGIQADQNTHRFVLVNAVTSILVTDQKPTDEPEQVDEGVELTEQGLPPVVDK